MVTLSPYALTSFQGPSSSSRVNPATVRLSDLSVNSSVYVLLPATLFHVPTSFWAVGLSAPDDGAGAGAGDAAGLGEGVVGSGSPPGGFGGLALSNWSWIAISFRRTTVWLVGFRSLRTSF